MTSIIFITSGNFINIFQASIITFQYQKVALNHNCSDIIEVLIIRLFRFFTWRRPAEWGGCWGGGVVPPGGEPQQVLRLQRRPQGAAELIEGGGGPHGKSPLGAPELQHQPVVGPAAPRTPLKQVANNANEKSGK